MSIIIGGDLCPTSSNREAFIRGDTDKLFGEEIIRLMRGADLRVVNLETPLCDSDSPIKKCGPALRAPVACVNAIKALGIDLASLANNHVMDHGAEGLASTIDALRGSGIRYLGAGADRESASEPVFIGINGLKFGFISFCENEFSAAEEASPGAAPFDPLYSFDMVSDACTKCDHLTVLYHCGKELYPYPSPEQRRVCRRLVDKGAALVLCQHSHCIGCEEKYAGSTILYGQGNFLLDSRNDISERTSLLVEICDDLSVKYIPLVKRGETVRLAEDDEREDIIKAFLSRSEEISSPGSVEKRYADFAESKFTDLLADINGRDGLVFKALNKLSGNRLRKARLMRRYPGESLLRLLNRIECEDWRELIICSIKTKLHDGDGKNK